MLARAFSLIELMVVIAIVAVLSAAAVPAYNSYMVKARLATVMPIINHYINKSIEQYSITGTFANAAEVGLPTPVDPRIGVPTNIPFLNSLTMQDLGTDRACRGSTVNVEIVPDGLGDSSITGVYIYNFIFDIDNIVKNHCMYFYVLNDSENGSDALIPGCINGFTDVDEAMEIQALVDSCD